MANFQQKSLKDIKEIKNITYSNTRNVCTRNINKKVYEEKYIHTTVKQIIKIQIHANNNINTNSFSINKNLTNHFIENLKQFYKHYIVYFFL